MTQTIASIIFWTWPVAIGAAAGGAPGAAAAALLVAVIWACCQERS